MLDLCSQRAADGLLGCSKGWKDSFGGLPPQPLLWMGIFVRVAEACPPGLQQSAAAADAHLSEVMAVEHDA